jgi:hypothetical protein
VRRPRRRFEGVGAAWGSGFADACWVIWGLGSWALAESLPTKLSALLDNRVLGGQIGGRAGAESRNWSAVEFGLPKKQVLPTIDEMCQIC